jgi:hypothetical protein
VKSCITLVGLCVLGLASMPASAALLTDGFETGVSGATWEAVPGTNIQILVGDSAHAIGNGSAKQVNADPFIYYMRTKSGAFPNPGTLTGASRETLTAMFWDDLTPYGPGAYGGAIMLANNASSDFYQLGVNSAVSTSNYYWRTATDLNNVSSVARTQGWHALRIEAYPYTGNAGDVKFYIDGQLVANGKRKINTGSGFDLDQIRLGLSVKTPGLAFWYDNVALTVPEPVTLALLAPALALIRRRRSV